MSCFWSRARLMLVWGILLLAVWFGLKEGSDGVRDAESVPERAAAGLQVGYGIAAVACLWALYSRAGWYRRAFVVWVVAITLTGTIAPVVWAGAEWRAGAMSGLLTLSVASLVTWGAFAHFGRDRIPAGSSRPAGGAPEPPTRASAGAD